LTILSFPSNRNLSRPESRKPSRSPCALPLLRGTPLGVRLRVPLCGSRILSNIYYRCADLPANPNTYVHGPD
jgi:hypothetical protein